MSGIKKNFLYNAVLTVSSLILPFIAFPYVTRTLAPDGIGLVNFANSFIQYFVIVSSLGVPLYGIREISKIRDNVELRSKILIELFVIKLACSVVALIVYAALVFYIPEFNSYLNFYLFGAALIVIGIFDFNFFFSAMEDFRFITIRSIVFQILSIISVFLIVKSKDDTLKYFIIPIFFSVLNAIVNTQHLLRFVKLRFDNLQLKRHFKPLVLLFSIMLFTSIYNLLDTTILGLTSGHEAVGFYSVAAKVNKVPISLLMVLAPVMLPRISREFHNENFDEIKRLISKVLQFIILIGVPITVGLYATAPELITLLSGSDFAPSITTIRILSPVALIIGITTTFSTQLLIPMGQDKHLQYSVIIGTVISVVLNLVLTPVFRQDGSAIANLLAEIVVLLACYFFTIKHIKISIPLRELLLTLLICIPFLGFIAGFRYFSFSPSAVLVASVMVSFGYYVVVQFIFLKNSAVIELTDMIRKRIGNIMPS